MIRVVCSIFAILAASDSVNADGLFQSKPAEGSWVTFETTNKLFGPRAVDSTVKKTWTNKALGIEERNGAQCRWIEVRESSRRSEWWLWNRILIPEADIARHGLSTDKIVEAWTDGRDRKLEELSVPVSHNRFRFLFPGVFATTEFDERRTITFKNGELKSCSRIDQEYTSSEGNDETRIRYSLWRHDDVPFGVAEAEIELIRHGFGKHEYTWNRKFKLLEFGTGAVSDMKADVDS